MKIKDCIAFAKCVRNPGLPLTVDAQTVHGESSTLESADIRIEVLNVTKQM